MGCALILWLLSVALAAGPAAAQSQGLVVRDGSLGDGPLEVGPGTDPLGQPATYLITPELGEQRGSNLFHSFSSFGVGTDETATFTGPDPIDGPQSVDNVISRVSGGNESQIDGTLRSTIPGADLFLINPSGVVFGEGATLDVPGSFHASTGDYLGFGAEGLERFYGDPLRESVLSTAPPGAFGFLGDGPAAAISVTGATLSVHDGETFELVGGDVSLTGATLDASGETPGMISIRGGRVVIEASSRVLAENLGEGEDAGGTISVAASESVLVDDSLLSVNTWSAGDAGSIYLTSPEVTFQNGPGTHFRPGLPNNPHATEAGASAQTSSAGAGGMIDIDAGALVVSKGMSISASSYGLDATGDAGTVFIDANSVDLSARSDISAGAWRSQGNGGAIEIDADTLRIDAAEEIDAANEYAFLWTTSGYQFRFDPELNVSVPGAPGSIDIQARSIELLNGGAIQSRCVYCSARLGAGFIKIEGESLLARGNEGGGVSGVSVNTAGGEGDAGTLVIDLSGSLTLRDGGFIDASTSSSGGNGVIQVKADSLVIEHGGQINANAIGEARGGSITVGADSVEIRTGGFITASSLRGGDAGAIHVTASDSILLDHQGGAPFSLLAILANVLFGTAVDITGIFSATVQGGHGGSITLTAPEITVTNGAIVATSTVGGGDAGDLILYGDRIRILNGGFVDSTSIPFGLPGGAAGSITLVAQESIEVMGRRPVMGRRSEFDEWSRVSSATLGSGAAGAVLLDAPRIVIDGGAVATTAVAYADRSEGERGGDITVLAGELTVQDGGRIDASTFVVGAGGSIGVTARESIRVEGLGSGIASRAGGEGEGGNVALHAPRIAISDGGKVSAESTPRLLEVAEIFASLVEDRLIGAPPSQADGDAGSVTLIAEKEVLLTGGTIATNAPDADGGSITIEARDLVHLDSGVITATVTGGTGGNVFIDPDVVILQNGSRIEARAGTGEGGHIDITADNYFAFPGSVVSATAGNPDLSGTVEVNAPDTDLAGTLAALPASYLDASSLMRERCAARRSGERAGSFAVRGNGGIPAEPDGWLPGAVAPEPARPSASSPVTRHPREAGPLAVAAEGCASRGADY